MRWQSLAGISLGMVFQSVMRVRVHVLGADVFQRCVRMEAGAVRQNAGSDPVDVRVRGHVCGRQARRSLAATWCDACSLRSRKSISAIRMTLFYPRRFWRSTPSGRWPCSRPESSTRSRWRCRARGTATDLFPIMFEDRLRAVSFHLEPGRVSVENLLPSVFNDFLFHDEKMLGASLALHRGRQGDLDACSVRSRADLAASIYLLGAHRRGDAVTPQRSAIRRVDARGAPRKNAGKNTCARPSSRASAAY